MPACKKLAIFHLRCAFVPTALENHNMIVLVEDSSKTELNRGTEWCTHQELNLKPADP
jgi:hypothetical protein